MDRRWSGILSAVTFYLAIAASSLAQPAAEWPHTIAENGATVTVYQPQAISWPDRKELTARAAIAIKSSAHPQAVLGTIEITVETTTDAATQTVRLSNPRLVSSHFPALDTEQATALDGRIRAALPHLRLREVPINAVLISLKQTPDVKTVDVSNTPPTIFYSSEPASLVVFDGDPVLVPAGKSGLSYAANTNWEVFKSGATWYLLNNGLWLSAAAATGPYAPVSSLPAAFNALPADANFADVRKYIPARRPADRITPKIFVSMKPAEIIVTEGPPQFDPVPGTSLQRVKNTANTLIFDTGQKQFYFLVSGRWFSSPSLQGPWAFATNNLPPEFALIPKASAEAPLLTSVPGTVEAEEAVLKSQIPTTATLKRSAATLSVAYSGPPRFEPIPGTAISYAVNTNYEILKVGNAYYACYQGAWFISNSPNGPWVLTDSVPPLIYTIPPTSPVYNVTYVQVYGAAPASITYGYTAGYMMGFVTTGVLVYGTGYYYPPVVVPGPVPIFYPYPYTYAGNVWYNSTTGAWARGGTIYGPYNAVSGGRYHNASTGGWAQGAAVYGPYGGAGAWSYYNPRTGTYGHGSAVWGGGSGTAYGNFYNSRYGISGATTQNVNPYSRWGSSSFAGPNKTVNTASGSNARGSAGGFNSSTGAQGAGYHNRATGSSGGAVRTQGGDVYAGRDGNVYRHTDQGWSKYNNGAWNTVQPPTNGTARYQGAQPNGASGNARTAENRGGGTIDAGNYQQLEQDRLGRQFGTGRFGEAGGLGGRFAGGGGRFAR